MPVWLRRRHLGGATRFPALISCVLDFWLWAERCWWHPVRCAASSWEAQMTCLMNCSCFQARANMQFAFWSSAGGCSLRGGAARAAGADSGHQLCAGWCVFSFDSAHVWLLFGEQLPDSALGINFARDGARLEC